ncbi:MAG: RNA-binding S4 domain-containing protein [Verrucomicrobiota bacterium]
MSNPPRFVEVRAVPIDLCQFIKFAGLAPTGGEAQMWISVGEVKLNGAVETRKRKKLFAGDRVELRGETIIVKLP